MRRDVWREIKLGSFLQQSTDNVQVEIETEYPNIGIFSFGRGVFEKPAIQGASTSANQLYRIKSGQLIYSRLFAFEGAYSIVPRWANGYFVSNEFPVFDVDESIVHKNFLYWLFRYPPLWQELGQHATGMGDRRKRLHPVSLLDHSVQLPGIQEQQRLATEIASFASRLAEAKQLRQSIQANAQAMLHSAFKQVIEGAEYRPMAEVAPIVRRPVEIDLDGEYHELGVRSFGKGTFHKPILNGIDVGTKKLYQIHADDLVFSNVFSWEGAIAVAKPGDTGRVGSHRFITCVAKEKIATPAFLCFYLLTPEGIEKVREASPGGAGRNRTLGLTKLEKITVPIPGYERQLWFNRLQAYVAAIQQSQADNQAQLDALLPSILDRAFKGEL